MDILKLKYKNKDIHRTCMLLNPNLRLCMVYSRYKPQIYILELKT